MDRKIPKVLDVLVIGAGFSGLGQAIHLKQLQKQKEFSDFDFAVFEKEQEVGGTWWVNQYPGCACDVQSHLYSFSFAPNPNWSMMFAPQKEILGYLKECVSKFKLEENIFLGLELVEAEWHEERGQWISTFKNLQNNETHTVYSQFLISAIGALSRPFYPEILGLQNFKGKVFHSQQWDKEYDFTDKNVAVIGTGASAIQFVPQIAPKVKQLYLYQRTPPWILPKMDRGITWIEKQLFKKFPISQKLYRALIYVQLEMRAIGFTVNPKLMKLIEKLAKYHIKKQVKNKCLQKRLTPDYTIGCKRILISNDYYPTLNQKNVELLTGKIKKIEEGFIYSTNDVVTDAQIDIYKRPIDALVLGTGFNVINPFGEVKILGRDSINLKDVWDESPQAFLGTSIHGFPNLFTLLGPNTGLGHNSVIYMIESQIHYIDEVLKWMRKVKKSQGKKILDIQLHHQLEFNKKLQQISQHNVWSSGCQSWYLDKQGRNFTIWPTFTWKFRQLTQTFDFKKYDIK